MTPLDALYQALPLASPHVRAGVVSNCGGMASAQVDIERAPAYELVDATPPPRPERNEDQEIVDFCVTHVAQGIEAELAELFGELPAVRVTLRRVHPHWVDANEMVNRCAGRGVIRLTLTEVVAGLPAPATTFSHRVTRLPRN